MQLGEISFCDRVGFNVKSDEVKKALLTDLENITGFRVVQKHYERFTEQSQTRINSMPHMISLRSNGNPYLLYLTKCNYENQVIFIDKKIQHGYFYPRIILSKLWFDPDLFKHTLLDGEMVKTNHGDWHFIVNDIICLNGELLHQMNHYKRMFIVNDILEKKYKDDEMNCCSVFVKRYFRVTQLQDMLQNFMPQLPYTCRGIYFKPFYLKFKDILYNFDDTLIKRVTRVKIKHTSDSTFLLADENHETQVSNEPSKEKEVVSVAKNDDIKVQKFLIRKTSTPDVYELFDCSSNKENGLALVNNIKTSKLLREAFRLCNVNDKLLFICEYNEKFMKWVPLEQTESAQAKA
jgi:hypothetical protein